MSFHVNGCSLVDAIYGLKKGRTVYANEIDQSGNENQKQIDISKKTIGWLVKNQDRLHFHCFANPEFDRSQHMIDYNNRRGGKV